MAKNGHPLTLAYELAVVSARAVDKSPLDLAEALFRLQQKAPERLKEFIASTGVSHRRAYYLIRVWAHFRGSGISKTSLAAVGWTKLEIIARCRPTGDLKDALKLAAGTTAKKLPALLKGQTSGAKQTRCMTLYFTPSQYAIFAPILEAHGATPKGKGLANKEKAIIAMIKASGM